MNNQLLKRFSAIVLSIVLVIGLALPVGASTGEKNLVIVHTNDVHARVDGEAYVSTYVKQRKAAGDQVLLISAGDILHGQNLATLSRGKAIADIMNAAGYDVATAGNHDFNYGTNRLLALADYMKFDFLVANMVKKGSKEPVFEPYVIKDMDGIKVGIFGIATPETATKTNPNNVKGYEFLKPVPVAQKMVKTLQDKGADVIIAVTHLGVDEETLRDERSGAVAAIEGIDLVVDGHSHTKMPQGLQGKHALVVQTGNYLENFGVVEMKVGGDGVSNISASLIETPVIEEGETKAKGNLQPDPNVTKIINAAKAENEKLTSEVIGETPVDLMGEREIVRTQESNLANLITDAMLTETGADIALTNGGGIRDSIPKGKITKGDVLTVLPFGNYICTIEVKGSVLLKALEHGVDATPEPAGHFSQVGGMIVEYDSSRPAGSRIISVKIGGKPIELNKTYTLATNDFMAVGGDNYDMFENAPGYMVYGSLDDALIKHLQKGADIEKVSMKRIVDVKGTGRKVEVGGKAAETTEKAEPAEAITETATEAKETVYVVKAGDYLAKIAKEHGTTVDAIVKLNELQTQM